MRQSLRGELLQLALGLALFALAIELLARGSGLPGVVAIFHGLRALRSSGQLVHDVEVSAARALIGWSLGAVAGVLLGLATGRSPRARLLLEGFLIICRSIPFISLLPLTVRLFGVSETGKIFLVAWATAGVTWVVVHQAARSLPQPLIWLRLSLDVSWSVWLSRILLGTIAPAIQAALRASLALGLIVVAVAEMSGVYERSTGLWWSEGLGYRLFRSLDEARDDLLLAGIVSFAVFGVALDRTFVLLWRASAALGWHFHSTRARREAAKGGALQGSGVGAWAPAASIDVQRLDAGYGDHAVLHGLSLHLAPGRTLVVLGPSGCGKTTLVRALGLFEDASFHVRQKLFVAGERIERPGPWAGLVMQDAQIFGSMTVWDNLVIVGDLRRRPFEERAQRAFFLLERFGLAELAARRADTLSGGQRQRLALATAVANRPRVLLLDEPFGALDWFNRRAMQDFYLEQLAGKVTAIFVTHDLHEALRVGDHIRVGVTPDATTLDVDRRGLPPREWEQDPQFAALQRRIIELLEQAHGAAPPPRADR